jgi:hypothetical protein
MITGPYGSEGTLARATIGKGAYEKLFQTVT